VKKITFTAYILYLDTFSIKLVLQCNYITCCITVVCVTYLKINTLLNSVSSFHVNFVFFHFLGDVIWQ